MSLRFTQSFDYRIQYFLGLALVFLMGSCSNNDGSGGSGTRDSLLDIDSVPAVQVLVPGFSAQELPLDLTNINVLRYGSDGRLYGLAYDGHIYVLTDSTGDGIEDKAEYWWDKGTLVTPVGMVVANEGIYVTSHNKVSLLKDTDNDGIGDTEEIITSDWVKPQVYTGTTATGVDAFGIAQDEDGNIFFALGSADFTNGYLIDSLGNSNYDINSERGTVLKITPGSSKREIYCTGTRFPVAMAFNAEGDLFASEQEGATWLANGNPYDELLHIQEGRHYGFPPRHPEYLPSVIDEPSVFDYKPQHQSTCGLNFNLPVNDGPVFGPQWWTGDAFVGGLSRGKIYRTKLVKTASGYVARNDIFASLPMLVVDAAISPTGDIVVATHAGPPDWGYGPTANGKLYKITYSNPEAPSPVAAFTPRPDQLKISFDKPLTEEYIAGLSDNIEIEFGKYVEAADRFEVLRPGYKAVGEQISHPRGKLQVKSVYASDDRQTLIINTVSHISPVKYAVTLPAFNREEESGREEENEPFIVQSPAIDLSYDLNGVETTWKSESGSENWSGWVPHLELEVSKAFLNPSPGKEALEKVMAQDGVITFKTRLDLWHMLYPDIQPGMALGHTYPLEDVNLFFKSSQPLEIKSDSATVSESVQKDGFYETKVSIEQVKKQAYPLEVSMKTGGEPALEVYYTTAEDSRPRALHVHRFFMPWLENIFTEEIKVVEDRPELAGGNWGRGKKLFFGESTCATCHSINGEGKAIGPDLSNLVFRDYESVLRDINDPSATINPDYLGHTVTLKDGRKLTGFMSYKKDSVVVMDITGTKTTVPEAEVVSNEPLPSSLMPPGLDKMLGEQKMKDLMAYLLTSVQPTELVFPFLPPIRRSQEVKEVLERSAPSSDGVQTDEPFNILWVSGPKDHGPDEHDYPLQQKRWHRLLSLAANTAVDTANAWPTPEQFDKADVIVFYWNYQAFNEDNGKDLDAFLEKGGGLVYLHYAVDATQNPKALANRIGLAWKGGVSKFRHGRQPLDFADADHPITRGFEDVVFEDESYWELIKGDQEINVLASGHEEGKPIPMLWTTEQGKGRVFVSILGHFNWTFDDPLFRILLLRGISWAGNRPTDEMIDIINMGARVSK